GTRTHGDRRYPVSYLIHLRTVLRMNDRRGYIGPAEDFSRLPEARAAIVTAETNLDLDIKEMAENGNLPSEKIQALLDVGRTTLNLWQSKDAANVTKAPEG